MAKDDTKFIKVIITKRIENVELAEHKRKEIVSQGGLIKKNGKNVAVKYTMTLGQEALIPENFVEYIKERKSLKYDESDTLTFIPLYNVEVV